MPNFSVQSLENLSTVHLLLQMLAHKAIKHTDFTVVYGRRTVAEQLGLMRSGASKVDDPRKSYHVADPPVLADAFDAVPYVSGKGRITGNERGDERYFYHMIGRLTLTAEQLGVPVTSGGDWDSDGNFDDQSFHDLYHFQLNRSKCRELGIYEGEGLTNFLTLHGYGHLVRT